MKALIALTRAALVAATIVALASPAIAAAQGRRAQGQPPDAPDLPGISPAEVQQMFDSAALIQAQQQLNIRDEQFPQFLRRFKMLQEIRRAGLNERMRHINQLRLLINAPTLDEAAVNEHLKALRDIDARVAADVARAYDAIDQVLDVRQRARFRVFEEQMERQKLELVTRARQANRAKP
jgi:Spy/CpxP family protein refolding chaperone